METYYRLLKFSMLLLLLSCLFCRTGAENFTTQSAMNGLLLPSSSSSSMNNQQKDVANNGTAAAQQSSPSTVVIRIGVIVDQLVANDTDFQLSKATANQIFSLAARAGNSNMTRIIANNASLKAATVSGISIEPVYLRSRDLYLLFLNSSLLQAETVSGLTNISVTSSSAFISALLEVTSCSDDQVDCKGLQALGLDVPDLTIVTTCCWRLTDHNNRDAQRNIVYNSLSADEMAAFILELSKKFGWQRFAFLISPNMQGVDQFFRDVNNTIQAAVADGNNKAIYMRRRFYSPYYSYLYSVSDDLRDFIGSDATAFFFLLDGEGDTLEVLQRLQRMEDPASNSGWILDEGKAYFLVEWSSYASQLPKNGGIVPKGLMLLRRRYPNPSVDRAAFNTNYGLRRNLRNMFYEEMRILSAAVSYSASTIDSGVSSIGQQLQNLYCNTTYSFEEFPYKIAFDESCQRRSTMLEVLNVYWQADMDPPKYQSVPIFEFQGGKLRDTSAKPDWAGSGKKVPIERLCDLDNAQCPIPIDIRLTAGSSGGAVFMTLLIVLITVVVVRCIRRRDQQQRSIRDLVIARYAELHFFEEEGETMKFHAHPGNLLTSTSTKTPDRNTPSRMSQPSSLAMFTEEVTNLVQQVSTATAGNSSGGFGEVPSSDLNKLTTALFRGDKVFVKLLQHKIDCEIDDAILQELMEVRNLQHVNINALLAVTTEKHHICTIQPHCSKGTLAQVLFERKVQLDRVFKLSFASDIAAGMAYLHQSNVGSHGRLSSDDILVDSRWFCRIANIPLPRFETSGLAVLPMSPLMAPYNVTLQDADGDNDNRSSESPNPNNQQQMFFNDEAAALSKQDFKVTTAPELLRFPDLPMRGTKQGDIYSFGIILTEIITRKKAFSSYNLPLDTILRQVAAGSYPPFRPQILGFQELYDLLELARFCMEEIPAFRPGFVSIVTLLRKINNGKDTNLVETMLQTMEHYAVSLEQMVTQRTSQLNEEKKRSDELLSKMLPRSVVEELKANRAVNPESYESVTVSFLDVVGFTKMASESTPIEIVEFLNDMYSAFDTIIESYDVYKVETIGDSYMVASGLPKRNQNRHAGEIATMALDIMSCVATFRIRHRPGKQLQLRCGVHSGSAVAGVVGLKMPRYCLFGDTVNYASRMESSCLALRIQVSPECKRILDTLGGYHLSYRGLVSIKGKGEVATYYLEGKDGFNKQMPDLRLAASLEEHEFK